MGTPNHICLQASHSPLRWTTYLRSTLPWSSDDKTSARATWELAFPPALGVSPPPPKELAGT